jgi:hypothetical protein
MPLGIYKLKKIQVGLLVIQSLEPVPTASCILRPPATATSSTTKLAIRNEMAPYLFHTGKFNRLTLHTSQYMQNKENKVCRNRFQAVESYTSNHFPPFIICYLNH